MPFFFFLALSTVFGLVESQVPGPARDRTTILWASADSAQANRMVFLTGRLSDEALINFTANVAASNHPGIILLDSVKISANQKHFLQLFRPERMIPVGSFPDGIIDLERRLDFKAAAPVPWTRNPPFELWKVLFPQAPEVVICSAKPRRLLLQAACLAGVLKAPLYISTGEPEEASQLRNQLTDWNTHEVYAVGQADLVHQLHLGHERAGLASIHVSRLRNEEEVSALHVRRLRRQGPIQNLVVTNPTDGSRGLTNMSALAPWIALQHQAVLILTNEKGTNVGELVSQALTKPALHRIDAMILVGDLKAIPMECRPNPLADGKDAEIEMEPLTPTGTAPFTLATGRLFNADRALVPLMLARQRLRRPEAGHSRALVVSNPTGGLPLLEAFSRNTTKEFLNNGYQTTALFGNEVNADDLRNLLPEQDVFLWEGHYSTLMKEYKIHEWTEPTRPSFVFLQSCLALSESKAQPFLQRGALAVVGSSTRTYSGSGGACALAFFDALLYEDQTLGGALRQAKNFLLAYSLLKEKRLGLGAKLTGANVRSAWAFTLWGDPTLKLPRPESPADALPHVSHTVHGNTIVIHLPDTAHAKATTSKYQAQMLPNARLAGLLSKEADEDGKPLVPFIFAEVHLPKVPAGKTPHLRCRLPDSHWVFCWDERRSCGYLLITPRAKDHHELRFYVEWRSTDTGEETNPKFEVRTPRQTQMSK